MKKTRPWGRTLIGGTLLTLAVGLGAVAVTPGAAAAAGHYDSPTRVALGWTDSAKPGKAFAADNATDLPLGIWSDDAGTSHTSRVYATFDLSKYEGAKVTGGTVAIEEKSAADCTKRSIELWRTKAISATPTWNKAPAELTKLDEIQTPEYCPRASISFDASVAVADAIAAKQRLLTLELRVSAEHEADPAYGRRLNWYRGVSLSLSYNTVPTVDSANLYNGGFACSQLKPYRKIGGLAGRLQALINDPDPNEQLTTEYSIWPTGQPDAAVSYSAQYGSTGRVSVVNVPLATLVQGQSYAWQARVTDGTDTSAWSKKCYFTYDGIAPSAPAVTSPNFPPTTWGPVGQNPTFVLDGHKDKDIAGFEYTFGSLGVPTCSGSGTYGQLECQDPFDSPGTIKADVPGGKATVTLNPDTSGAVRLTVRALDTAGNRSPATVYTAYIPRSEPTVTLEGDAPAWNQEVLLKIVPAPGITGVTEYEIDRAGLGYTESRTPDENGVAYYRFTAYEPSGPTIKVRSISDNGFRSAPATWQTYFSPWPGVKSELYSDQATQPTGGVGVEGSFTFSPPPGWYEVKEYRYSFDDWSADPTVVTAGDDGKATVTWTPDTAGYHFVNVSAVKPDGTVSEYSNYYSFQVADTTAS